MSSHLPGPRTGDKGLMTREGHCQLSPKPRVGLLPGTQWGEGKGRWWAWRSWEGFSVLTFFAEILRQVAAKIRLGQNWCLKMSWREPVIENNSLPRIGPWMNDCLKLASSANHVRIGARKGQAGRGFSKNRENGTQHFLKHDAWQKCLAPLLSSQPRWSNPLNN